MDLQEAKALTIEKMTEHGLTQKLWRFEWSRAKQCFGRCIYRRKIIRMSAPLCQINERESVLDTILHEIAHALVGSGHGHDRVWKAKAIEIGCNGKRCFTKEDSNCIARPSVESATIYGVTYREGDTITLRTRRGVLDCTFVRYMPRNHKYPIIAKTPFGKQFKFPTSCIVSKNDKIMW